MTGRKRSNSSCSSSRKSTSRRPSRTTSKRSTSSRKNPKRFKSNQAPSLKCYQSPNKELTLNGKNNVDDFKNVDLTLVKKRFKRYKNRVKLSNMRDICEACNLSPLWKRPLYHCFKSTTRGSVCFKNFAKWWKKFEENTCDESSRFVYILTNGTRKFLVPDDFYALIQDVIDTIPSLNSLKQSVDSHHAYIQTVTARIFWNVCKTWNGRISTTELRLSNLLKAIKKLETEEVDEEREFFSYEQFYIIHRRYALLDMNEKDYLTPLDLTLHAGRSLTNLVVKRIFSGTVLRRQEGKIAKTMDYTSFVYFLLAEVNKCHPRSVEYWFRVMDINGDGRITLDEMECFYTEILARVYRLYIDTMSFKNVTNMLIDMISPKGGTYFTLSDLKRSLPSARYFFNTFLNWRRHLIQENNPYSTLDEGDTDCNDWDKFCEVENGKLIEKILKASKQMEFVKVSSSDEILTTHVADPTTQGNNTQID